MTFLECVAATALLAMVASSIFGVFGFVVSSQTRQLQRLASAELANRLVLMYLDDPISMPEPTKTLEYGPHLYRFEFREQPLALTEAVPEGRDRNRPSPLPLDRFTEVSVRVWLSEKSGGTIDGSGGVPQATVSRMFDPLAFRNPDSIEAQFKDPVRWQRYMERLMGFRNEGPTGGARR